MCKCVYSLKSVGHASTKQCCDIQCEALEFSKENAWFKLVSARWNNADKQEKHCTVRRLFNLQIAISHHGFVYLYKGWSEYHLFELWNFGSNSTEYSKLWREGAEHILLSNKGRDLYVCMFAFLCRAQFIQSI